MKCTMWSAQNSGKLMILCSVTCKVEAFKRVWNHALNIICLQILLIRANVISD
ncbi:zinc finger protein 615 [Phyllostomus discolor]|uniref:Zinc finger protein 615 n=1 Tax=Phyllostomus discolor TaxID=89673 RepID=A0A833YJ84_9CHIR|nr:zinc finger protein 615 [Phyllostomus discolor]